MSYEPERGSIERIIWRLYPYTYSDYLRMCSGLETLPMLTKEQYLLCLKKVSLELQFQSTTDAEKQLAIMRSKGENRVQRREGMHSASKRHLRLIRRSYEEKINMHRVDSDEQLYFEY